MPGFLFTFAVLFAQTRRGRALQKLWEGDPVAWGILIIAIVIVCVVPPLWRRWRNRSSDED